jgi:hypothetical protein
MFKMKKANLILLPIVLFLGSCASANAIMGKAADTQSCPQAGFLSGADRSEFTLNGVSYETAMAGLTGGCTRLDDAVRVTSQMTILVNRTGDTLSSAGGVSVPYFAGILDGDGNLLTKQTLTADVSLDATGRGQVVEELTQRIPLKTGESAGTYQVVYGFPEE